MRACDVACVAAALLLLPGAPAAAQLSVRSSLRSYEFVRLQDKPGDRGARYHAEFVALRALPRLSFGELAGVEAHAVLELMSPAGAASARLAAGRTRTWLPLDRELHRTDDVELSAFADRLNFQLHTGVADLVVGRQALTWGVNTLWPALDLFAPFAPLRIDRDYKPGVDAARVTVPLGAHSEVQAVGAVLGDSLARDWAAAALLRISIGAADVGVMGGSFHGDTVVAGFATASLGGTVLRGELSHTWAGDPGDRLTHPTFWRGGIGVERQLTPTVTLVAEFAGSGYGARHPAAYAAILASDRVQRGEVAGPGRWYAGTTFGWQFHPLGMLTNTALVNLDDRSTAWVPWLSWSLSDGAEVLAGAQFTFGKPATSMGVPRSDYGSYSNRLLAGFKIYR